MRQDVGNMNFMLTFSFNIALSNAD